MSLAIAKEINRAFWVFIVIVGGAAILGWEIFKFLVRLAIG